MVGLCEGGNEPPGSLKAIWDEDKFKQDVDHGSRKKNIEGKREDKFKQDEDHGSRKKNIEGKRANTNEIVEQVDSFKDYKQDKQLLRDRVTSECRDFSSTLMASILRDMGERLQFWLFNDAVSTTRLFSVDEIDDSEMVFGEISQRIRHRLPGIHLTVGENLGKNPTRHNGHSRVGDVADERPEKNVEDKFPDRTDLFSPELEECMARVKWLLRSSSLKLPSGSLPEHVGGRKMLACTETCSNVEVPSVIQFLRLKATSPPEIHRHLVEIYEAKRRFQYEVLFRISLGLFKGLFRKFIGLQLPSPTDQEEEKEFIESLAEKKLPSEGFTGRNDEREKSSGQEISDDRRY
ncbi:hypothetical protein ANN_19838 [Periplaneta americana]|uniref:Uncharacterized protein n=1 Tax=Periplaneta americana TaxID=6978 RepID=A0ABQ8SC39_PERAM|nr:hypothetical protein ANN_19838 [Periplaneta americana]